MGVLADLITAHSKYCLKHALFVINIGPSYTDQVKRQLYDSVNWERQDVGCLACITELVLVLPKALGFKGLSHTHCGGSLLLSRVTEMGAVHSFKIHFLAWIELEG